MVEEFPSSPDADDLDRLKELIALMDKHGLTEVDLRRGDQRWKLRRGPQEVMQMVPAGALGSVQPAAPAPVLPAASEGAAESSAGPPADGTIEIKSPTVGTFYAAPSPDDPPFAEVGTHVSSEMIVCVVEAMKVFNQIPAEVSGTITEVLVANGDPVEFGQPLFRVRPG